MENSFLLSTPRLLLRRYRASDLDDYYAYISDPEVVKYEPYRPMTREEAEKDLEWRIGSDEMIAVELAKTHRLIGNVYLGRRDFSSLELGYVFHRAYWGKGFAKEACTALIERCFAEGTHRIFAECDPENENSWRLLEALGFSREAHFRKNVFFWQDSCGDPIWKDTYVYAKLNPQS